MQQQRPSTAKNKQINRIVEKETSKREKNASRSPLSTSVPKHAHVPSNWQEALTIRSSPSPRTAFVQKDKGGSHPFCDDLLRLSLNSTSGQYSGKQRSTAERRRKEGNTRGPGGGPVSI